ncbi:NUDIX domain-containing protein [Streptomyces zhaozhouensis]|uniref:NUDIX domain-containing protein n=1 Tax=Streptomyces zhaozhouensis TaxID=1300267 RepID=A0A286DX22_9ACTN|nr:NUDIX domain-containing protein [Streptomyces zhaozhouensis]
MTSPHPADPRPRAAGPGPGVKGPRVPSADPRAPSADPLAPSADPPGAEARDELPAWLRPLAEAARTIEPRQLSAFLPPPDGGRPSAVLVLFGEGECGPELLLLERASSLRQHAGQASFPGGALDPEDGDPEGAGPWRAALREAEEETGLDPAGVRIFATLPRLYIPVSRFVVSPVLAWWRKPTPVAPQDPAETARVFTVPLARLCDPAHRGTALHPSGYRGPCFEVADTLVWGFTAGVIDRLLHYGGWEKPWDDGRLLPLDHSA